MLRDEPWSTKWTEQQAAEVRALAQRAEAAYGRAIGRPGRAPIPAGRVGAIAAIEQAMARALDAAETPERIVESLRAAAAALRQAQGR